MERIEEYRSRIDSLDDSIMELLLRRFHYAREIGKIRQRMGVENRDNNREHDICRRLVRMCPRYMSIEMIEGIWGEIFSVSRELQNRPVLNLQYRVRPDELEFYTEVSDALPIVHSTTPADLGPSGREMALFPLTFEVEEQRASNLIRNNDAVYARLNDYNHYINHN